MSDINKDWYPAYDKPAINTWYPCKRGDDYYKILLQSPSREENGIRLTATYRVVSMRGADIGFDLTLSMARILIMKETRRSS